MRVEDEHRNHLNRKCGRPGNLLRAWSEIISEGPIVALTFPELGNSTWFMRVYGHLRNLSRPENGYKSGLTLAMQSRIAFQMGHLRQTPLGKFFQQSAATQMDIPDMRLSAGQIERAIEISQALLRVGRRDPYIVRTAVLGYCSAVSDRKRIHLTDPRVAQFGQILVRLIKDLKLPWLEVRLLGYQIREERGDLNQWLNVIRPARSTSVDFVKAENQSSRAELGHIGIDVRNRKSKRTSHEFFVVMVAAAIVEIWRCVWLQKRSHGPSEKQLALGFASPFEEGCESQNCADLQAKE